jgi:hypothetical protein
MKHEDLQRKAEQLADKVGDVLTMEKIELEVVMSVLISMLVSTAISQANMTGVELLRLFSQAVEKYEDATKLMEKEIDDEQIDSRTTH